MTARPLFVVCARCPTQLAGNQAYGRHCDLHTWKRCSCGYTYTRYDWQRLQLVGVMRDEFEALELRNCSECSSTMAVEILDAADGGEECAA